MSFQSAPDQLIGRYTALNHIDTPELMFQSAPDQLIGRYKELLALRRPFVLFQSAPDQLIGRYRIEGVMGPLDSCFNPRPTN